jgi:predicted HTH domain antitoxin
VELSVPDHLLAGLDLTADQWRFDLALGLYMDEQVSSGRAAEIAGMSRPQFLDELGKRRVPIQYGMEELESDLKTIAKLRNEAA